MLVGLGQLFEIKPRCCGGSLLAHELGSRRLKTPDDLTRSFPRVPAGALGSLGSPNLAQAGRFSGENLWPSAIRTMAMRIIHKPVALAWRQRASAALRARAAATLPCRAFVNNPHGLGPTRRLCPLYQRNPAGIFMRLPWSLRVYGAPPARRQSLCPGLRCVSGRADRGNRRARTWCRGGRRTLRARSWNRVRK
jgi:hypothetical protein